MSKKETGTRATRWLQQPIAAAWQLSYPRCISCPFCASALYHPQQNLTPRTGRPLTEDSCVVSQWSNVSCLDVLLFIVNLWYFKHVGKCSVAYHCKVIEVFVIRDLTTALCYYNSAWKWNKASRFCVCVEALRSADLWGSTVLLLLFFFFTTVSNTAQILCLSLTSQHVSVPAPAGQRSCAGPAGANALKAGFTDLFVMYLLVSGNTLNTEFLQ